MRVTTEDTTTNVHTYLVPERFIKPHATSDWRGWYEIDELRMQVDPDDPETIRTASEAIKRDAAANPTYFGDYRIVMVHIVTTTQVVL